MGESRVEPEYGIMLQPPRERGSNMSDESYNAIKSDFIMVRRIIYREGLSDAFARLRAQNQYSGLTLALCPESGKF